MCVATYKDKYFGNIPNLMGAQKETSTIRVHDEVVKYINCISLSALPQMNINNSNVSVLTF